MKYPKRIVISLLTAAILLFLGLLFWPFVINNVIRPIAQAVWFLLRILVLGIHQKYFWYAVIIVAFIVVFRLLPKAKPEIQSDNYSETNSTLINIGYWRVLFTYDGQNVQDVKILKRELMHLLSSLYASKQSVSNDYGIYDALQNGDIPLPENIYTYLFPQETPKSGRKLTKFFRSIQTAPHSWIHRWTGQEKAEHYQMIDEVLNFMETSLEIKHDDRKNIPNEH
jgi:hypothetical protein